MMKPTKKETPTPPAPVVVEASETVSEAVEPTEEAEVAEEQETVVEAAGDDGQETAQGIVEPTEGAGSVVKLGAIAIDLTCEPLAVVLDRLGEETTNKVERLPSRSTPFQYLPLLGAAGQHAPVVFDTNGGLLFGAQNIAAAMGAGKEEISVITVAVTDTPYAQSFIAQAVNSAPRNTEDDDLIYRALSASPA